MLQQVCSRIEILWVCLSDANPVLAFCGKRLSFLFGHEFEIKIAFGAVDGVILRIVTLLWCIQIEVKVHLIFAFLGSVRTIDSNPQASKTLLAIYDNGFSVSVYDRINIVL